MHDKFCFVGMEKRIRTGAAYRMYIDGKITNIHIMGKVIARDIIEIWRNIPTMRNNLNDVTILKELKLQFSDLEETDEFWLLMMSLSYDFGYMRGRKSMRDVLRGRGKKIVK